MAAQASEANNATDETPAKVVPLHALLMVGIDNGRETDSALVDCVHQHSTGSCCPMA